MRYKIGIVSLGCPKNTVDTEWMIGLLNEAGFDVIDNPTEAAIIIVNTCGFIGPAKEESIEAILHYSKFKTTHQCKLLVVTGCLAQRYASELSLDIPEIDVLLGTGDFRNIVASIEGALNGQKISVTDGINKPLEDMPRKLTTAIGSAYLKISEGCDNLCTYCVIPNVRGKIKSRTVNSIVSEAKKLAQDGVKEIILVGQDITKYGVDLDESANLIVLLKNLVEINDLKWIRLLYLHPSHLTNDLLQQIAIQPKICKYIDIPIQHINDLILNKMNRNYSSSYINSLIKEIRTKIPSVIIRTSFIVGFPGENQSEYEDLVKHMLEIEYDRAGVFSYSVEEGTPAAAYADQVDEVVKIDRRANLLALQKKISKRLNRKRLGEVCEVIIVGKNEDNIYIARSYAEAPNIDGNIYVISDKPLEKGEFVNVKITKTYEYDLLAEQYEFSK